MLNDHVFNFIIIEQIFLNIIRIKPTMPSNISDALLQVITHKLATNITASNKITIIIKLLNFFLEALLKITIICTRIFHQA